jgi:hypothetical protein
LPLRFASVVGVALAPVLGASGCGGSPGRSPRVLDGAGTLIVSNSPMLRERPLPTRVGDDLSVPFAFIVENVGAAEADLDLSSAEAIIETRAAGVACRARGHAVQAIRFAAGERWRIDCMAKFTEAVPWLAQAGDREAKLKLGLVTRDGTYRVVIPYFLKAEDAR